MIIGKSFALWKENRSPKATDNNKKGIWGKLREREREKSHWWSSTTDEERGGPRDYGRRNNLSLIYIWNERGVWTVYILQVVYCWVLQILPNRSQRCCRCVSFFSCWIPESIQATPERKLGYNIFDSPPACSLWLQPGCVKFLAWSLFFLCSLQFGSSQ
jgi:hypothetical protein